MLGSTRSVWGWVSSPEVSLAWVCSLFVEIEVLVVWNLTDLVVGLVDYFCRVSRRAAVGLALWLGNGRCRTHLGARSSRSICIWNLVPAVGGGECLLCISLDCTDVEELLAGKPDTYWGQAGAALASAPGTVSCNQASRVCRAVQRTRGR